jgi:ABC-type branched-subunit amino acid transport system permease subunit
MRSWITTVKEASVGPFTWRTLWFLVVLCLAVYAGVFLSGYSSYLLAVAITALIYIVLSLSFDLVVGRVGLLSLTHGAFFGIGAYVAALTALHFGLSFPPRFLIAAGVGLAVALLIGIPCFRLGEYGFAMSTLGFGQIAYLLSLNWRSLTRGPLCLPNLPPLNVNLWKVAWTARSQLDYYLVGLACAAGAYLLIRQFVESRIGRAWEAIREDGVLAAAVGVHVLKYQLMAFAVGAAAAAAIGAFYASYATLVCPTELALTYSTNLIIMLFLGGRGTMLGPILGALLVTAVPEYLRVAQEWRFVFFGVVVILTVLYMPQGIARWLGGAIKKVGTGFAGPGASPLNP